MRSWPPAALRGLSEGPPGGGTRGRSIPDGVTTPLGRESRPMDATIAASDAKILRIFYENPFLEKIFAYWPPAALRGLSEGPPGGGTQGRSIPDGVTTPFGKGPRPMDASVKAIGT